MAKERCLESLESLSSLACLSCLRGGYQLNRVLARALSRFSQVRVIVNLVVDMALRMPVSSHPGQTQSNFFGSSSFFFPHHRPRSSIHTSTSTSYSIPLSPVDPLLDMLPTWKVHVIPLLHFHPPVLSLDVVVVLTLTFL